MAESGEQSWEDLHALIDAGPKGLSLSPEPSEGISEEEGALAKPSLALPIGPQTGGAGLASDPLGQIKSIAKSFVNLLAGSQSGAIKAPMAGQYGYGGTLADALDKFHSVGMQKVGNTGTPDEAVDNMFWFSHVHNALQNKLNAVKPEQMEVVHTGEPISTKSYNAITGPSGAWQQDTYKTPDGGTAEFMYDTNGKPSHVAVWDANDHPVGDFGPHEVYFPPKAVAKSELHTGGVTEVSNEINGIGNEYATKEGGTIYFNYDKAGNPVSALSVNNDGEVSHHTPDQVKFPPVTKNLDWDEIPGNTEGGSSAQESPFAKIPPEWEPTYAKLATPEKEALANYSSTAYKDINKALVDPDHTPLTVSNIGWHIEQIDSALAKARLPEDHTLYRGLRSSVWSQVEQLKPGEVWQHTPYASTSINEGTAKAFSSSETGGVLKILAPKGTPALYIAPLATHKSEQEILLARGVKLRMIDRDPETNTITMQVTQ